MSQLVTIVIVFLNKSINIDQCVLFILKNVLVFKIVYVMYDNEFWIKLNAFVNAKIL